MSVSTASLRTDPIETEAALPAWKAELNRKLEAHRQRRGAGGLNVAAPGHGIEAPHEAGRSETTSRTTAARVAARVAERYAQAPSYSEVLAARAATAAAAAEAAAFAVEQAQVAAEELLSSLAGGQQPAMWEGKGSGSREERGYEKGAVLSVPVAGQADSAEADAGESRREEPRIEHPEPLPARSMAPTRAQGGKLRGIVDAFAEAEVPAAMGLPAKLIEFPRELVAAQRARPRIAEGPLAEESLLPALRIFEVEGEVVPGGGREIGAAGETTARGDEAAAAEGRDRGRVPDRAGGADRGPGIAEQGAGLGSGRAEAAPEWQSIRLSEYPAHPEEERLSHRGRLSQEAVASMLHVASASDRAMAALVDVAVVGAAFFLFVMVFAVCTAHPPVDRVALGCGAVVLGAVAVFYQWLLLSYGGATLGMRYAQIALCTFDDENPTRRMLRSRVWASLLAALPLGVGLVWAVFDEDSLGWHDRMTRTYQRSYR